MDNVENWNWKSGPVSKVTTDGVDFQPRPGGFIQTPRFDRKGERFKSGRSFEAN
jgi:hypothetical protein